MLCCGARRRLTAERGADCVSVCVLSKLKVIFSTKMAEEKVFFAEQCFILDVVCG